MAYYRISKVCFFLKFNFQTSNLKTMKKINYLMLMTSLFIATTVFGSITEASSITNNQGAVSEERLLDDAVVMDAMKEFKSLSRVDRKMRMNEVKSLLKEYKAQKAAKAEPSTNTILLAILAILLPPLAVYLHEGSINGKFWLSLLLTLCFWIPGVIYALIVVL
jgi:uncharacterized membrane protein YqaE (UPF0057 family)